MSSKDDSKPGFFKRLFGGGSKKSSGGGEKSSTRADGSSSTGRSSKGSSSDSSGLSSPDKQKPRHSPLLAPPVKTRTSSSSSAGGGSGGGKSPTTPPSADAAAAAQPARKPRRQTSGKKSRRHRKKTKAMIDPGAIKVDVEKPIEFPTTPEMILAYHKARPFLGHNEEWLLVELNEYECLVDSIDIIKTIADHSKFFEVEPDQLWEEFFEFVDEVPSYDEIINWDVWQEFRDVKYQC